MSVAETQSAPSKPKLRWYQYSLRTLLVFTLLVSVGMSWTAVRMRRAKRQLEAAREIEKLGGLVLWQYQVDESDRDLFHVDKEPPGPSWLRKLLGDTFFTTPADAQVCTDAELEHVGELTGLRRLFYGGEGHTVSRQGTEADVPRSSFTDQGMKNLVGLADLEELELYANPGDITERGFRHLKGLNRLRRLDLTGTWCDGFALANISELKQLQELNLLITMVTDHELTYLTQLYQLRILNLWGTQVTDAGLENLKGLTELQQLVVSYTKVTDRGVKKLQQALPNCRISWSSTPDVR